MSARADALIDHPGNRLHFSVASIWEVAIKAGLARSGLRVDPRTLRRSLLENAYVEVPVEGEHALGVARLPSIHRDPFDRLLIARAKAEGPTLLTADAAVAR